MVKGLDTFRTFFADYGDRYVLIGGVAAFLIMDEADQAFRATKDLDIVLVIEALDASFVTQFWRFVTAGGYQIRQRSDETPVFYRFMKPADESFPAQVELFSRTPHGVSLTEGTSLTPIPVGDALSSLSAILLNDEYYAFLLAGARSSDSITHIGADRLIPLKAHAWLNLDERRRGGEQIDSRSIRKHRNDVLSLSILLAPGVVSLSGQIAKDLNRFLERLAQEKVDVKGLGISGDVQQVISRIRQAFVLN